VNRDICDVDRRGIFVCITEDGRARHEAAQPTHRAVICEVFTASEQREHDLNPV
jgi:DNA-binding MarR family transcriptional regulator